MQQGRQDKVRREYYQYLERSGISSAFQIIFNEIVSKAVPEAKVFEYTAARLREFKHIVETQRIKEQLEKEQFE